MNILIDDEDRTMITETPNFMIKETIAYSCIIQCRYPLTVDETFRLVEISITLVSSMCWIPSSKVFQMAFTFIRAIRVKSNEA